MQNYDDKHKYSIKCIYPVLGKARIGEPSLPKYRLFLLSARIYSRVDFILTLLLIWHCIIYFFRAHPSDVVKNTGISSIIFGSTNHLTVRS